MKTTFKSGAWCVAIDHWSIVANRNSVYKTSAGAWSYQKQDF